MKVYKLTDSLSSSRNLIHPKFFRATPQLFSRGEFPMSPYWTFPIIAITCSLSKYWGFNHGTEGWLSQSWGRKFFISTLFGLCVSFLLLITISGTNRWFRLIFTPILLLSDVVSYLPSRIHILSTRNTFEKATDSLYRFWNGEKEYNMRLVVNGLLGLNDQELNYYLRSLDTDKVLSLMSIDWYLYHGKSLQIFQRINKVILKRNLNSNERQKLLSNIKMMIKAKMKIDSPLILLASAIVSKEEFISICKDNNRNRFIILPGNSRKEHYQSDTKEYYYSEEWWAKIIEFGLVWNKTLIGESSYFEIKSMVDLPQAPEKFLPYPYTTEEECDICSGKFLDPTGGADHLGCHNGYVTRAHTGWSENPEFRIWISELEKRGQESPTIGVVKVSKYNFRLVDPTNENILMEFDDELCENVESLPEGKHYKGVINQTDGQRIYYERLN